MFAGTYAPPMEPEKLVRAIKRDNLEKLKRIMDAM